MQDHFRDNLVRSPQKMSARNSKCFRVGFRTHPCGSWEISPCEIQMGERINMQRMEIRKIFRQTSKHFHAELKVLPCGIQMASTRKSGNLRAEFKIGGSIIQKSACKMWNSGGRTQKISGRNPKMSTQNWQLGWNFSGHNKALQLLWVNGRHLAFQQVPLPACNQSV